MIVRVPMIVGMAMIVVSICAYALHMVVMTLLSQTNLVFGTDNLHAVLAKLAVHVGVAFFDFLQFFYEGVDDFRVVI